TMTLLRRLIQRERLSQAHRSHIYQRLAQALGSHAKVVGLFSMINVIWVLPVAYGLFKGYFSSPLVAMMACYLPLLGIWLALHQRLKLD
ncbi:MAG: glycosyl transferase, partial [Pseudomonadota bacterium]|nr:glycosyl transferase [Pseudomonadota bacterium]